MSSYRYGILGAGRQGTAAAYDLLVRGDAASVTLADIDGERARASAERVNRLAADLPGNASGVQVDAADTAALDSFLRPLDAAIGAISYKLNLGLAAAALDAGTHWCDLGGNTDIVFEQLKLNERARAAGLCIVPDCGEAPGLANNLEAYAMGLLDEPEDVLLLDGGLPLHPEPPWNYRVTFAMDGLTNEYAGGTTYVRDGMPEFVGSFDPAEYELVDLGEPVGTLEAFATGGGSTIPWTLGRRLRRFRNKVLRYPGHAAQFKAFQDAGLFSEEPIQVDGVQVVPRQLFHALIEPQIRAPDDIEDIVIARVIVKGTSGGRPSTAVVDLRAFRDDELGFSAMEQTTGWHAAIVAHLMASGRAAPGARPPEEAVDSAVVVEELRRRGFRLSESIDEV
jgi:lysine 6-dehydrogenase